MKYPSHFVRIWALTEANRTLITSKPRIRREWGQGYAFSNFSLSKGTLCGNLSEKSNHGYSCLETRNLVILVEGKRKVGNFCVESAISWCFKWGILPRASFSRKLVQSRSHFENAASKLNLIFVKDPPTRAEDLLFLLFETLSKKKPSICLLFELSNYHVHGIMYYLKD